MYKLCGSFENKTKQVSDIGPIVRLNCGDSHESSNGTPRIASQSAYLLGFLTLCALLPRSVPISWPSWNRCRSMPGHARREFREHEKCSSGPCCSRRSDWPAINGRTSSRSNASSTGCPCSRGSVQKCLENFCVRASPQAGGHLPRLRPVPFTRQRCAHGMTKSTTLSCMVV
jgi:hypothetical protein